MEIITLQSNYFGSNTYILKSKGEAYVVDPAAHVDDIIDALHNNSVVLKGILLTHGHFDHVLSLDALHEKTDAPIYIGTEDAELLTNGRINAYFEFFGKERTFTPADRQLLEGDTLKLGNENISVLHTPGHTRGSLCFYTEGSLISGDTLFAEGYGRYDLYGGNVNQLAESLKRLSKLPEDTVIYPGHGECSRLKDAIEKILRS